MPLLLLVSMGLFGSIVLSSFKGETVTANQVAGTVRQKLLQDLDALKKQAGVFTGTLRQFEQQEVTAEQVQEVFYQLKHAYKKTEYLVEYLDPELAKSLNGAPIPKVVVEHQP